MENTLERIAESAGHKTHEDAVKFRDSQGFEGTVKVKIVARNDGTFDVIWFQKKAAAKTEVKVEEKPVEKKVHGLKAKDRKKLVKKSK